MTKDELLRYIEFESEEEMEDAEFYIGVKGVALHIRVLKYLNFDFRNGSKIKWSVLAEKLKQDKLLRDKLYIYLATLEEYVRAYISNKYEYNSRQQFWINGKGKRNEIKDNIDAGKRLFDVLEETDFGTLLQQVKVLPDDDREMLFGNNGTGKNIDAIRELRNAVGHHKFVFSYKFAECEVDGVTCASLENNIRNLRQLLPPQYRFGKNGCGGITADMKKCNIYI